MVIITSDCIINMAQVQLTYIEEGYLLFETTDGLIRLTNYPDNALQQIAMALAQGKEFLEIEDAKLVVTGGANEG